MMMDGIDEASMEPIFKSLFWIEIVSKFFLILWFFTANSEKLLKIKGLNIYLRHRNELYSVFDRRFFWKYYTKEKV